MERWRNTEVEKKLQVSSMEILRCKDWIHKQIAMERCRDIENKFNLNDFTIKINGHKKKRGYGMLASWNEKKI